MTPGGILEDMFRALSSKTPDPIAIKEVLGIRNVAVVIPTEVVWVSCPDTAYFMKPALYHGKGDKWQGSKLRASLKTQEDRDICAVREDIQKYENHVCELRVETDAVVHRLAACKDHISRLVRATRGELDKYKNGAPEHSDGEMFRVVDGPEDQKHATRKVRSDLS
ncbi:hypothetical protein DAEQUDRAFT_427985 [Daedalea quercina L-15889]|uniref:Uncharacterized protein n=1 Tax=Daedalea quercina L-15889 TaxID=1314783 RepID=A0A165NJ66_9APHY|nr:hypothetical protein DAEQUDRAFT_427985 [Daedalea quercina L-15889]